MEVSDNFKFEAITAAGTFTFKFKWLNERWNCWVTFPDGSVREAGVYPGVVSWSGFKDHGLLFRANTAALDYDNLLLSEIYLLTWQ